MPRAACKPPNDDGDVECWTDDRTRLTLDSAEHLVYIEHPEGNW